MPLVVRGMQSRMLGPGMLALCAAASIVLVSGLVTYRSSPSTGSLAAAQPAPLELVGLEEKWVGNRLIVRGEVANPVSGRAIDRLTVVVLAFGDHDGSLASGRSATEPAGLQPGSHAAFEVAIPDAADVARYRVGFRSNDGVVAHVDRRRSPL